MDVGCRTALLRSLSWSCFSCRRSSWSCWQYSLRVVCVTSPSSKNSLSLHPLKSGRSILIFISFVCFWNETKNEMKLNKTIDSKRTRWTCRTDRDCIGCHHNSRSIRTFFKHIIFVLVNLSFVFYLGKLFSGDARRRSIFFKWLVLCSIFNNPKSGSDIQAWQGSTFPGTFFIILFIYFTKQISFDEFRLMRCWLIRLSFRKFKINQSINRILIDIIFVRNRGQTPIKFEREKKSSYFVFIKCYCFF